MQGFAFEGKQIIPTFLLLNCGEKQINEKDSCKRVE